MLENSYSIYIWSTAFTKYDNNYLVNYLKVNGYTEVILSINKSLIVKTQDFVNIAVKNGLSVQLMIANNSYVYPENYSKLLSTLNYYSTIKGVSGIHLDIEPHTLDDWTGDYSNYIDMLGKVRVYTKAKSMVLTVSIPVFYTPEALQKIYSNVDMVYLMAYERPELDYIIRKIYEEIALDLGKVNIALRTKDFVDKISMNSFCQELIQLTGVCRISIHDITGIFEFDKI